MTESPDNWTELIRELALRLELLDRDGVRWLNVAEDPDLDALLTAAGAPPPVVHEGLADLEASRAERNRPQPGSPQVRQNAAPEPSPAGPTPPATHTAPAQVPAPARESTDQAEAPAVSQEVPQVVPQAVPQAAAEGSLPGTPPPETPQPGAPPLGTPPLGTPPHPSTLATLESLRFQFRDCRECGLADTRNRLVFGVGSNKPRMMFIGEGPGADEDEQGLPFVGRAGKLLTGLIRAMGLTREDVYITNVVKCRPPGNRNPEPGEMAACRPILQRQIELLAPGLIVTLGNVPLKLLKPNAAGITKERGNLFDCQGVPVLPTFHPSYLLRNPAAITTCWEDFRQAMERITGAV